MADTEIDAGQLEKLSDLAKAQLQSILTEGFSVYDGSPFEKILDVDIHPASSPTIKAELEDIQQAGAYVAGVALTNRGEIDKELTEYYSALSYGALERWTGTVYFVFKTNGDYNLGHREVGVHEVYYTIGIRARCNGENILEFWVDQKHVQNISPTFEDAEFVLYRDIKPTQKLEF